MDVLKLLGVIRLSKYKQLQSTNTLLKSDRDVYKNRVNELETNFNNTTAENTTIKEEIKSLKEEYGLCLKVSSAWEWKHNTIKAQLEGRIGGLTKEVNKHKSQLRFALGILYKDVRSDKETEIFLKGEYKKLKAWDEARRKPKEENNGTIN